MYFTGAACVTNNYSEFLSLSLLFLRRLCLLKGATNSKLCNYFYFICADVPFVVQQYIKLMSV